MKFSFSILAASLIGFSCGYIPINSGVTTGFENWEKTFDSPSFNKLDRYALIVNPTSVIRNLTLIADYLHKTNQINIVALAGPEHGIRGAAQAGEPLGGTVFRDLVTGLPIYDGYSFRTGAAWAQAFNDMGVDTLVFDIQDAGSRFYTYIWTLYDAMVGATLAGKKMIVLDRPNPISGDIIDGDVLNMAYSSFIGRRSISTQHGMTVAELAMLFNNEFLPVDPELSNSTVKMVELEVVKMSGWDRSMFYDQTGLNWILPSPNMPNPDTALVYPGQGFFEGTALSEGRGTTQPFIVFGSNYLVGSDLTRFQDAMNSLNLPGVIFSQYYFNTKFSKLANSNSGGLKLFITDRSKYRSVPTTIALLSKLKEMFPAKFQLLASPALQLRTGTDSVYNMLNTNADYESIIADYQSRLKSFESVRSKYLLY
ncbi:hypothetical protein AYI68_g4792 [Smittium mucronatum]|uniref:DUF1343 domain-containing protein n=1 Tax=Smittium mucronatum TaxID=133383 RepID=A0A1R0GW23_9FUNG|nr:hypothetical protein AYI68_g4792 [Smittium mucronatum]